jgi:hypothetical protein
MTPGPALRSPRYLLLWPRSLRSASCFGLAPLIYAFPTGIAVRLFSVRYWKYLDLNISISIPPCGYIHMAHSRRCLGVHVRVSGARTGCGARR